MHWMCQQDAGTSFKTSIYNYVKYYIMCKQKKTDPDAPKKKEIIPDRPPLKPGQQPLYD